jgi:hypothetical protein
VPTEITTRCALLPMLFRRFQLSEWIFLLAKPGAKELTALLSR